MKRISYEIFGDSDVAWYQNKTTVDVSNVSAPQLFNYIEEVISERFAKYNLEFNHVGRTVRIDDRIE